MKIAMTSIFLLGLSSSIAHAQPVQPTSVGGYTGPGATGVSVADARVLRDDAHVRLRGKISQHVGGERYQFVDASGSIHVEIDADVWQGQSVGADDLVEIEGEIDKDWNSVEIEVERLRKL
jgi:uncharacterized protein (TIGR00156 family)